MKKLTLALTVVALALIPTLIFAQPPRPGHRPQTRPQVVHPSARPTMQVHAPARPAFGPSHPGHGHVPHRPPVAVHSHHSHHHPAYYPPVVHPGYVVAPHVVAPYNYYPNYYPHVNNGFSLTIGGRNGAFSISSY